MKHGKGTYFYRKGERYEGEWKQYFRDGEGILWGANNSQYVGTFKGDKKHGPGSITLADGTRYYEEWSNGLLITH